jgi:hypothetical protein
LQSTALSEWDRKGAVGRLASADSSSCRNQQNQQLI